MNFIYNKYKKSYNLSFKVAKNKFKHFYFHIKWITFNLKL